MCVGPPNNHSEKGEGLNEDSASPPVSDIRHQKEIPCDQNDCIQTSDSKDDDHKPPQQSINSSENKSIHAHAPYDPEGKMQDKNIIIVYVNHGVLYHSTHPSQCMCTW